MFMYFSPDRNIPFAELTDGRFNRYGIQVQIDPDINGRPTASLTCGDSKLLVRVNSKSMASTFVPLETDIGQIQYMLDAIGFEFNAVCSTEYDGPYKYVRGDVEGPECE